MDDEKYIKPFSLEFGAAAVIALINLALDQADIHFVLISWVSLLVCSFLCVDGLRRTEWASIIGRRSGKFVSVCAITVLVFFGIGLWITRSRPPEKDPFTVVSPVLVQNNGDKIIVIANCRNNTGRVLKVRFIRGNALMPKPISYESRTRAEDSFWALFEAGMDIHGQDQDLSSRANGETNLQIGSQMLDERQILQIRNGSLVPYFFAITQERESKEHLAEICVYLAQNLTVQNCTKHNKP
jgi:hypothetical protein